MDALHAREEQIGVPGRLRGIAPDACPARSVGNRVRAIDEQKRAAEGTVEAWGRSESNPVGGWYGMVKGLRGRFGVYMPPLMEALGLVELTHDARGNKMRAK